MSVAEAKPLTAKQQKFADLVAGGKTRTAARREVYVESPKYPKATSRRAVALAEKPNVAAEIKRLTWLSFPPLDNTRGMREQAVRVLSDLSRTAPPAVRLQAALALYKISETTRAAADPRATDSEQDKLLASLRKLYATIQGNVQEVDIDGPDIGPVPKPYDDEPIDIQAIALPADPATE